MQMVIDVFGQIFGTLWAHKLRSFLTMFGIAWGVGSLLLLVGLGEGFRTGNQRNLSELGENIMMIFPGRAPAVQGSTSSGRQYRLTYQDYLDIRKEAPHVRAAAPVLATSDVHAVSELAKGIGGVGLMNIMLVSVTQRTREIGVEKALGARRRHIFFQFLAEALTITFIGGVMGIILAYAVALSVGRLTLYSAMAKHAEAGDIRLMINPMTLIVAVLILGAVGLISGMVPAIRASRLDPIEALRYE